MCTRKVRPSWRSRPAGCCWAINVTTWFFRSRFHPSYSADEWNAIVHSHRYKISFLFFLFRPWPLVCSFCILVSPLHIFSNFLCPVSWDPPLRPHSYLLMPSILGSSSTPSLYLLWGLPTGLSPPNVLYGIFLGIRLLSMRSVCPAYCNLFNLSPPNIHGLSYSMCSLLLGYILFSICHFLFLLVAIFVWIFFSQIIRLCQSWALSLHFTFVPPFC